MIITLDRFRAFAPGCTLTNALAIVPALEAGRAAAGLTTPLRVCHFLAQAAHESQGFTRFEEDLSYSAERMARVWPGRYAVDPKAKVRVPNALAKSLARKPEALANNAYGGRFGNVKPGDGWKYRGRGIFMITFEANYRLAEGWAGLPLRAKPELAADPATAAGIALSYWKHKALNDEADRNDIEAITRAVQGGQEGLAQRSAWLAKAVRIFR